MFPYELLFEDGDVVFKNTFDGISVAQNGKTYTARKWKLTNDVIDVIQVARRAGLICHWQQGHPGGTRSHHISFSYSTDRASWVFVMGGEAHPPRLDRLTFSKRHLKIFEDPKFAWSWKREMRGGRNIYVSPRDGLEIIENIDFRN